jgi:hypothetical protein
MRVFKRRKPFQSYTYADEVFGHTFFSRRVDGGRGGGGGENSRTITIARSLILNENCNKPNKFS